MRTTTWLGLISAATMLMAIAAAAEMAPEWKKCTGNKDVDWDVQIQACSALIKSGRETKHNTAVAFDNRANAWRGKHENERSLADHNEAIRLEPNFPHAFFNRGNVYFVREDWEHAIADYSQAYKHDANSGDEDIAAAKRIDPNVGE